MKEYDEVRLIVDRDEYLKEGVHKGDRGTICLPEIRDNCFYVEFETGDKNEWYKYTCIKIQDLELLKESNFTDEEIVATLPKKNPKWWCKVEDGYIMNLNGDKKNKIPYDYNS